MLHHIHLKNLTFTRKKVVFFTPFKRVATFSPQVRPPVISTSSASDTIPVIAYIGGYCCDSMNKKLKCEECKLRIVSSDVDDTSFDNSLIKGISSGNLLHPNADILHIGLMSYIVIQKTACF